MGEYQDLRLFCLPSASGDYRRRERDFPRPDRRSVRVIMPPMTAFGFGLSDKPCSCQHAR